MMKTYAMVLNTKVIDVLFNCDVAPSWPPDAFGNEIVAVPCEDTVKAGMSYDKIKDVFFDPEGVRIETDPVMVCLGLTRETQLIMMEAMAEQYEQSLERELTNMEVQATIYETILELGGVE